MGSMERLTSPRVFAFRLSNILHLISEQAGAEGATPSCRLRETQSLLSGPAPSSERNSHKVWVLGFYTPVILLSANRENILETISFLSDFILNSDQ